MENNDGRSDNDSALPEAHDSALKLTEAVRACASQLADAVVIVNPQAVAQLPEIADSNEAFAAISSDINAILSAEAFIRVVKLAQTGSNLRKVMSDAEMADAKEKERLDVVEREKRLYQDERDLDRSRAILDAIAEERKSRGSKELDPGLENAYAWTDFAATHSSVVAKTMREVDSAQEGILRFVGNMADGVNADNNRQRKRLDQERKLKSILRWTIGSFGALVVPIVALLIANQFGTVWGFFTAAVFAALVFVADKKLGTALGRRVRQAQYGALRSEVLKHGEMLVSLFLYEMHLNVYRSGLGLEPLSVVDREAFSNWITFEAV